MGQPQYLGTEQPVNRICVRAQFRSCRPGRLVAPVSQQHGGTCPCRVVLVGVGQRPVHELLERGADAEQLLQVREDRPMPAPHGNTVKGVLVDAVALVVLDSGPGDDILGTRAPPQFRSTPVSHAWRARSRMLSLRGSARFRECLPPDIVRPQAHLHGLRVGQVYALLRQGQPPCPECPGGRSGFETPFKVSSKNWLSRGIRVVGWCCGSALDKCRSGCGHAAGFRDHACLPAPRVQAQ